MTERIVVTISHRLGRDGARRRIEEGLAHIRDKLAPFVSAINYEWTGHRLDFTVTALRQTVNRRIEREEARVRVELGLLLPAAHLFRGYHRPHPHRRVTEGSLLLNGPAKP